MKLGDLYQFVVREGMKQDPRGYASARRALEQAKKEYRGLKKTQKKYFDTERFRNPYSDTRILYGDASRQVKKVLVGIDIEGAELLMAEHLNQRGEGIDLVISHHPRGGALAGLHEVMKMQEELLVKAGLSPDVAQDLMGRRIGEVERGLHASNHARAVDAARLLNIPFMCIHTAADNHVASYLQRLFEREKPTTVGHAIKLLNRLPEYKYASLEKAGPKMIAGKENNAAGKILVDMTGGTEGSENIFARLSQAGIGTLVGMHFSPKHFLRVKDEHLNVIVAGHISSDNLGLNLLLDKLEKRARLTTLTCSGFKRVRRGAGS
jgi:putative NIF3 family GTP cyclohydrolase 1 type 2